MTDLPSSHLTFPSPLVDAAIAPTAPLSQSASNRTPEILPLDDPEDYTIKCICGYQEDDGSTVYCERCETWQHIECYYYDPEKGTVLDVRGLEHSCVDCLPRPVDRSGAIDRQRARKDEPEPEEKKPRKPAPKSHKKKIKVGDGTAPLTNGWSHDGNEPRDHASHSPRDQSFLPKRPKINHRPSSSTSSPHYSNSTTHHPKRPRSATRNNASPSKAAHQSPPDEYSPLPYSPNFLHLYDNDPGDTPMQSNLFNDITIIRSLSAWSEDGDSLSEATNGLSPQDVFLRYEQPIETMPLPTLRKESKPDDDSAREGQYPRWRYLVTDSFIPKDSVVGELRGKVGHMQDYVQDPANRWDYLRHPLPFVFFHPRLPIYIDTRSEGTACRYLRRSCRPNLSMKTFLRVTDQGSDYHFCFMAKDDLELGAELTIGWVLDQHIRNYFYHRNNDDIKQEIDADAEEDYVADWVRKVLADFGGCACGDLDQCSMARYLGRQEYHHNDLSKSVTHSRPPKGRNGHVHKRSPPSANRINFSRGSSEGSKIQDDDAGHGKSSRDVTPMLNGSAELGFVPGFELSDREKRKIAAMEKNFERDQDKHQPAQKKKKRSSGNSNLNTPSATSSVSARGAKFCFDLAYPAVQKQLGHPATPASQPNTPGFNTKPRHHDAGTSRRKSGSPGIRTSASFNHKSGAMSNHLKRSTLRVSSHPRQANYIDSSTQTDPDDDHDELYPPTAVSRRSQKPYMSLAKRLLLRCQQERLSLEDQSSVLPKPPPLPTQGWQHHAPDGSGGPPPRPVEALSSADVLMQDASASAHTEYPSVSSQSPVQRPRPPGVLSELSETPESVASKPPLPKWPASSSDRSSVQNLPTAGPHSSGLHVKPPSAPPPPHINTSDTIMSDTPTSATNNSPFAQTLNSHAIHFPPSSVAGLAQPSPAKKKVSLGEYMSRRGNHRSESTASATEKSTVGSPVHQHATAKPLSNVDEEGKVVVMEGSAIVDTPKKEAPDPIAGPGVVRVDGSREDGM